ncbi:helix-turn-helix domain-containing protein [Marinithermofilum abyssi]
MIGATRETVSATMSELSRQGIITRNRGRRSIRMNPEKVNRALKSE